MSTSAIVSDLAKRRTAEYWAARGVPEAKFVVSVKQARAAGAPQYGEMFRAWLSRNGKTEAEIDAAIASLEGRS